MAGGPWEAVDRPLTALLGPKRDEKFDLGDSEGPVVRFSGIYCPSGGLDDRFNICPVLEMSTSPSPSSP